MSYIITASTSVVLVPSSTGPFVVLFSSINATGRLITVRDNDGSASLGNPITLSTTQGVTFTGIASNTIQINQPYGFVTFACQPNGAYSILNTFAFPAGSAAANISNLFASTIGINTNNVAGYVLNVNGSALINELRLNTSRVALGVDSGVYKTNNNTTALGPFSGYSNQGDQAVAIGYYAGHSNQNASATAVGPTSGVTNQGSEAVAVGFNAGRINQGSNSIAIGSRAGFNSQPANSIILNASGLALNGTSANSMFVRPIRDDLAGNGTPLYYNSSTYEITRGPSTGSFSNFGTIYVNSTFTNYISSSQSYTSNAMILDLNLSTMQVALGAGAGTYKTGTATGTIAIGEKAGFSNQQNYAIAIGTNAGYSNQDIGAIAIGEGAGNNQQSNNSIAIGTSAGSFTQKEFAIAIGVQAGNSNQGSVAIGIGTSAGESDQKINAIAIGSQAGQINQGSNSIAIGRRAGNVNQPANSIVLNASGSALDGSSSNSFFVRPIREDLSGNGTPLFYNASTYEITKGPLPTLISSFSTLYASSTFTNYFSTAIIYTSNIGVRNPTPATNLVVDATTNNSLSGIAVRFGDTYTILGEEPLANRGSLQVTREGTSSSISNVPWNLAIQPFGGDTTIGCNNYAYTTTINGGFNVPAGNVGIRNGSPSVPLDVNGQVRISSNGAFTIPLLGISDTNTLNFHPRVIGPGFNNIVASNDSAIIFTGPGGAGTGNLAICCQTSGVSGLKITSNGNVGVGLQSPSLPLDVNGRVRITSNGALTNSLLTLSDANTINFHPRLGAGSFNPIVSTNDSGIIFTGSGGYGTGNLAICSESASVGGIKITSNGNVGIGVQSPATNFVVNVSTNNSLSGIAVKSADIYTILGSDSTGNNGSLQAVTGSASSISSNPWNLLIQPLGGPTIIGSANYSNTTRINGNLFVYGSTLGGITLMNETNDYRLRRSGVTTPGLLNYIPIAYLGNGAGTDTSILIPIFFTGGAVVDLPTQFRNKDDVILVGPKVQVTLYEGVGGSNASYTYINANTSGFISAATPTNAIESYTSIFIA